MTTLNARQIEDANLIKQTMLWPHWPYLPMQRYMNGNKEIGMLIDAPGYANAIVLYNLFVLGAWLKSGKKLSDIPKKQYPDLKALLLDGWSVD